MTPLLYAWLGIESRRRALPVSVVPVALSSLKDMVSPVVAGQRCGHGAGRLVTVVAEVMLEARDCTVTAELRGLSLPSQA